jgi:TRAP-type mannitol/chloroaromatic compound transport system permease small subunit
MQKLLLFIDRVSTWVGHAFSWLIVGLTLLITWEVFSRYALDEPHAWAFDVMLMLYGTLFMMAGAYTLSVNGHVRGDVLYGFFTPRSQATIDLILYLFFFLPGVIALVWAGYYYAADSWRINEHSNITAEGWPSRQQDVEEVDVDKLKEMVHVKDEDIRNLDALVVQQERGR